MKNIFVVEDYEKFESLFEEIKRKYNVDEFDIKIFDAEKTEIDKILSGISFSPIFSKKGIFVLKNVEFLSKDDCEKLYKRLTKIPPDIISILYGSSINPPFKVSETKRKFETPEEKYFSKICALKEENNKEIFEILREYMKVREKNFTLLISWIELYLRNIIKKEKKLTEEMIKKFDNLYKLDYFLKVGKIEIGSELEINLLYYFFSTSI